ncbi:MAG: carboxypeptidase regulatory-like domain-containing protein [Acidobacteriia bacterium]|nr:carboxypeptidase regulatory-like domain-containing protein [Terriglobia bacterium]
MLRLFSTLSLILLLAGNASPQSVRGSIAGVVTDASHQPLAGAAISLTDDATNRKRATVSDPHGEFLVTGLPPGGYQLLVEHAGYRAYRQPLTLALDQEFRVDVPLLAGNRTDAIVVTATRTMVRTDSAALGTVIENRNIKGLPLDGRNFYELALLVPGAAPAAPGSAGSVRGDLAFNINGAREDSNNFLLDGVYNGDPKLNTVGVTPPVDAIQEFEVLTSVYDASFGRNAGGQVNVVLKSGTNAFHGSAYEFFRNGATDARNFFAPSDQSKPQYQRNQFGATLGGPIRKNRTFFFADYEGRRVREGITQVSNVPTLAERAGDFSADPQPVINPFTQQPFAGNKIPGAFQNPVGVAIAALYPLPNRAVPGQNFVSSPTERDRDDHFDVRLDHQLARGSDLAFRYSFADRSLFEPFTGSGFAAVPGFGDNVPRRAQNVMLSETHVFSPEVLNEIRAGYNRVAAGVFQQDIGHSVNSTLGLPDLSTNPRDLGLSLISVTGFSPLGDEYNNPQHSASNILQLVDQVTYTHGRHLAKFGADIRDLRQNAYRDEQARGFISFLGLISGNPLADLLLGLPTDSGAAHLDNAEHLRTHSDYFFAEDTFRVRPDLTLSLGLRYEYNAPPVDAQNRANVFDVATQSLVQVGTNGVPRSGYEPDRNNWAPRVGVAWSPGNRSRVFRAGYGIDYDQGALATGEGLYFNPPYFNFQVYFPLPTQLLFVNDPFPQSFPVPYPSSALAYQRTFRTPYVQQWNFGIQQQIGKNRVVEIAYVGAKGTKLLGARDINQALPSPQMPNLRPNPRFADIDYLESRANSTYNSLQTRFQQRLTTGLSVLASYTWSKSIDDASNFFSTAGDANFPQNSYDVRAERARSDFDVRHRLSLSYSYDLPGHFDQRWLRSLLGGWQTFGILTFQSGRPFTVALLPDFDNSNTGISILGFGANNRPNVVGDPHVGHSTPDQWFNTSAFAIAPFGSFGNAGRNILDGPSLQTINLSLVKNARVREGVSLQFRAETFNFLNHPNFDLPDIFIGSPTFGHILSAGDPRHIQFGLKLLF